MTQDNSTLVLLIDTNYFGCELQRYKFKNMFTLSLTNGQQAIIFAPGYMSLGDYLYLALEIEVKAIKKHLENPRDNKSIVQEIRRLLLLYFISGRLCWSLGVDKTKTYQEGISIILETIEKTPDIGVGNIQCAKSSLRSINYTCSLEIQGYIKYLYMAPKYTEL